MTIIVSRGIQQPGEGTTNPLLEQQDLRPTSGCGEGFQGVILADGIVIGDQVGLIAGDSRSPGPVPEEEAIQPWGEAEFFSSEELAITIEEQSRLGGPQRPHGKPQLEFRLRPDFLWQGEFLQPDFRPPGAEREDRDSYPSMGRAGQLLLKIPLGWEPVGEQGNLLPALLGEARQG